MFSYIGSREYKNAKFLLFHVRRCIRIHVTAKNLLALKLLGHVINIADDNNHNVWRFFIIIKTKTSKISWKTRMLLVDLIPSFESKILFADIRFKTIYNQAQKKFSAIFIFLTKSDWRFSKSLLKYMSTVSSEMSHIKNIWKITILHHLDTRNMTFTKESRWLRW